MKTSVKDAIKLCAMFMRLEDVLHLEELGGPQHLLPSEDVPAAQKELALLLRCLNLVCSEIASDYFPLKQVQSMQSKDGYIKYLQFANIPIDIYSVRQNGAVQAFKQFPSEIKTVSGQVDIEYSYLPSDSALDAHLEFNKGKINERTIAYGTAAEYCLIGGLYEEALIWDKRYKDSLISAIKTVKVAKLPARRWA